MARSRRKTPIIGITSATSDKRGKQAASRRNRRVNREILEVAGDDCGSVDRKATGDPWDMAKDGKHFFDPKAHPKLMRK